jgi:HPt (histidine-containing phosphotransfer) domain-containing protein
MGRGAIRASVVRNIHAGDAMTGLTDSGSHADPHSAPVLDELVFDELRESLAPQPDALTSVYRKFLQGAVASINELPQQDQQSRISTVHTLKGSAAMLGANRLAAVAAQLQSRPEQLAGTVVDAAARQLNDEVTAFRHRINARFALLGKPEP